MANVNFPRFSPPPPPPRVVHPPSPENDTTVIVVVFVCFGGLFFLAFLAIGIFCLIKKRRNKTVEKDSVVRVDEHLKVKEAVVQGPHGPQSVVLSIDDDVEIEGEIKKNQTYGKGVGVAVENTAGDIEEAPSSSSGRHHFVHKP